jgi:hypothetical protein
MVGDDAMVQTQNADGKEKREWIMNQWHQKRTRTGAGREENAGGCADVIF